MAVAQGKVPIFESAGQGVRFAIEQWRFVLAVATVSALAAGGGFVLLGPTLLWSAIVIVVVSGATAALYGAALDGPASVRARLAGDTGRIFAASAIVGTFIAIIIFVIVYVAMGVLIAPYAEQAQAAKGDQTRLTEIMNLAVSAQPHVLRWAAAISALVLFLVSTRFFLVSPASVNQKRIVVFQSWVWTRGNVLRIMAARLTLLIPAFALTTAVQMIVALAAGAPASSDVLQLMALGQSDPARFGLIYGGAVFAQMALFSSLEAGLSTYLYRGLKPVSAQPSAA